MSRRFLLFFLLVVLVCFLFCFGVCVCFGGVFFRVCMCVFYTVGGFPFVKGSFDELSHLVIHFGAKN